jgi:multiple sugar transport system permease protein
MGLPEQKYFINLKLPYMKKYIILAMLFRICDSLKAFELIYSTTKGGPLNATRTLNIEAYEQAFKWSNIGEAMSIIFTLWIIAYIISSFLMKKWNESNED